MRKLAIFAAFALCAAGCSGDDDSASESAGADAFVGNWGCTKTTSLKFTTPAGRPDQTSTGPSNILFATQSYGVLHATAQVGDGGPQCNLTFHTVTASTAGLDLPGPSCPDSSGLSPTVTGGSATVGAGQLTVTLNLSFSGTLGDDAGASQAVGGTGTFAYSCTKQP